MGYAYCQPSGRIALDRVVKVCARELQARAQAVSKSGSPATRERNYLRLLRKASLERVCEKGAPALESFRLSREARRPIIDSDHAATGWPIACDLRLSSIVASSSSPICPSVEAKLLLKSCVAQLSTLGAALWSAESILEKPAIALPDRGAGNTSPSLGWPAFSQRRVKIPSASELRRSSCALSVLDQPAWSDARLVLRDRGVASRD